MALASPRTRVLREVEILARMHTTLAVDTLAEVCSDPSAPSAARVSAANSLLDRAWGKPKAVMAEDTTGDVMSDEDLDRQIASRLAEIARGVGSGEVGPAARSDDSGAAETQGPEQPSGMVH